MQLGTAARVVVTAGLLGVAVTGSAASQRSGSNRAAHGGSAFETAWKPVAEFFHQVLTDEGVVGGSIYFFHGDTVLAREFHGYADQASGRKVDDNTIYHWASITKTFTGIGLMQLRDRHRLMLDDPIIQYLPELRQVHDTFGTMADIKLRHLMSHSAGFRNPTWPWGGDKPWHPFEPTQWSQVVAMLPYTEILFRPGSRYSYSNPGIIFLGKVIEQLSGDDYEVYIDKNVFRPLGMRRSYYDLTPYHLLKDRSNNYEVHNGKTEANGLDFDTGITVSNGGLNAPIPDMLKYLQFLVGAPGVPPEGRAVLDRRSLEEMWQPVLSTSDDGASKDQIGLIFFSMQRDGFRVVGHTGSQRGFRSFFWIHPESQTGVIAAFNTAPADTSPHPNIQTIFSGLTERVMNGVFPLFVRK
jgi:CubicO group peptidase (beta-lactamase class C family)